MFTDNNKKKLIWDVLCLTSNQKVTALRTWARYCLYQGHTQYRCRSISQLECMTPVSIKQLRTTLWQKSTRSQKQSETKLDGSLKCYGANCSHQQTWRLWSRVNKPRKRGWNIPSENGQYPLRRDSKGTKQRSIIKIYCKKTCKNTKTGFVFSTYWRHNSAI